MDTLEEAIIDSLGKRGADLEADGAIEMLANVHDLSAKFQGANAALVEVEEQLTRIRHRFFAVADYGAGLVNLALKMSKLSSFYTRTTRYYFDIFAEVINRK